MIQYVTTLSKYFIDSFMALYTFECFLSFRLKTEKAVKGIYSRQIILMLLFQFSAFLPICLEGGDIKYIYFYIAVQVFLLTVVEVFPVISHKINRLLINNAAMLISIGLVMLVRLDYNKAVKQLIIAIISFVVGFIIFFLKLKIGRLQIDYRYLAALGFFMLLSVYLLGAVTNGSKLSVSIFGISFQASEFVKFIFVFFVAGSLYVDSGFKNIVITTIIAAAHVILLVISTDLGAALIFFVAYILMLYIATRKRIYLILGSVCGAMAAVVAYNLFRHVRIRVLAYLDPFAVIDNEGYQITQSLFAISGGGLFGRGLNNGSPYSIPYVETDFIFSAITEELGLIFSICLILVCISTFLMFVNLSFGFMDAYYRLSAIGLGIVYIFQVFLTIGGNTGFIPLTGITLPLVSYGGSSIMATIITICLIQGLYATKPEYKDTEANNRIVRGINKRQSGIILRIVCTFVVIFVVMIGHYSVYTTINREAWFNNPYNPIQKLESRSNLRGTIYSNNYEVLAKSDIDYNSAETRTYPMGRVFSHIIGFTYGSKSGVEELANYYLTLSNEPLSKKIISSMNNSKNSADSVVTTLDISLQQAVYDALGTFEGSVIISNPSTGDILAVVSKQDYNPETIEDDYEILDGDKDADVLSNKAFKKLYLNLSVLTIKDLNKELPEAFNTFSFSKVITEETLTGNAEYISPFELNMMTQALANKNTLMEPRLVSTVLNSKGNTVKNFKIKKYGKLFRPDSYETLTETFKAQAEKKWTSKYGSQNYTVLCITDGVSGFREMEDYSYFTGFATLDDRTVCVTVVLEGLGGNEHYAMTVAKKIFDTSFMR